ncbi:DUF4244 domain-containing protein [Naasia aerilata]|uniref:DUF4244 domain-containing protein n=1 Tax=Naasia aerilata TaxID=1162966 RepID=A0ABN6XQ92_9MICO|nr:DUF4244 domain-containing protein [Naasia aerilata]BDZ45765.1 hypothetical protein GCM10025866_16740 [Naasia aerilata]
MFLAALSRGCRLLRFRRSLAPDPDALGPGASHPDEGSVTAEYAVATMAAVGFAGLLVVILRSDEVRSILTDLVRHALAFGG